MARYFKKELPGTPLYLPIGKPIQFDGVDYDYGFYATNNGYEIAELLKCIQRKSGGVSEITEAEYNEWLKKKQAMPLGLQPRQRPSIGPQHRRSPNSLDAAAAVPSSANVVGVMADGRAINSFAQPQRSEGLAVNRSFVKPKVGKIPS